MNAESSVDRDNGSEPSSVPPGVDPDILKRLVSVEAVTVHLAGIQHEATVHSRNREHTFTFRSDEPPEVIGEDEHPYPLHYFTAAIGL